MDKHALRCFGITTEPFLFLVSGVSTVISISLQLLVQNTVCHNLYTNSTCTSLPKAKENQVQTKASSWLSLMLTSSVFVEMLAVPFVGSLADAVGKRRLMILYPMLTLIQGIIFLVISHLSGPNKLVWISIAMLIPGFLGGQHGALSIALGYSADVTHTNERTKSISVNEGFFYFAVTLFSLATGLVLKEWSFKASFSLDIALSILNVLYVLLGLPDEHEYLCLEEENGFEYSTDDNEIQALEKEKEACKRGEMETETINESRWSYLRSVLLLKELRQLLTTNLNRCNINLCLVINFFASFAKASIMSVMILYASHSPFNMQEDEVGYWIALLNATQSFGTWFLASCSRQLKDISLLMIGFVMSIVFHVMVGLSTMTWMLYVSSLFLIFGIMTSPTIKSILIRQVPDELHGTILAASEVFHAIANFLANFLFPFVYSRSVSIYPGTVMFVVASTQLFGLLTTIIFIRYSSQPIGKNDMT